MSQARAIELIRDVLEHNALNDYSKRRLLWAITEMEEGESQSTLEAGIERLEARVFKD